MNKYIAVYNGRCIEVEAHSSYAAQQIAAKQFKAKKAFNVTVVLARKDGEEVKHSTTVI